MLEPDWYEERPQTTAAAIGALWKSVRIDRCADAAAPVDRLLNALQRTHVNGGAMFAMFRVGGGPNFNWFMSRNRWDEIALPEHFLRALPVVAALPELCKEPIADPFGFEWGSAFTLAGELAQALAMGGAYEKHADGSGDAYAIADEFRRWMFGNRFEEMLVLKSHKAWSKWFCGVAWDGSWMVVDKRRSNVSVLALTDTD